MIEDLCIIMLTAGCTSLLFKLFKQPVVLGYIVAGLLVGPHALGSAWVSHENAETWGEVGVLFLLFCLGLEFSFKKLFKLGHTILICAGVMITGLMAVGMLTAWLLGWRDLNIIFLGGMLCMSSTTIVFKAIEEAGLQSKRFASVCFGVLIVEDLFAVALMVLLTSIAVNNSFEGTELLWQVGKLLLFVSVWFVFGILLIPTFLKRFKRHLNDETLVIFIIGLCLGMVLLTVEAGFSSALGAFVMGSLLAETVEAERIERLVQPVKNIFGAVFFVSVGMMIDPAMLAAYWLPITIITAVVLVGKIFFGSVGAFLSGEQPQVSLQVGFTLVQIGEFSFIIASLGQSLKVTDPAIYPIIVAVSVITTFLTPYIMRLATPAFNLIEPHLPLGKGGNADLTGISPVAAAGFRHRTPSWASGRRLSAVPVIGGAFRLFNENLYARERLAESVRGIGLEAEKVLLSLDISVAEMKMPDHSAFAGRELRELGIRGVTGASIVRIVRGGVVINIPGGDRRLYPGDHIVVAGTDQGIASFKTMLSASVPASVADNEDDTRITLGNRTISADSPLNGKTIRASGIRERNRCVVVGLVRDASELDTNPDPNAVLGEGDILIVAGEQRAIRDFCGLD